MGALVASLGAGCGARQADEGAVDAPGILVFSGLTSGSYLHAIRPDGSGFTGVELPETCGPERFSRDGRVLSCLYVGDIGEDYAVTRAGTEWRRVPKPAELKLHAWDSGAADSPLAAPAGDRIAFIRPNDNSSWFSIRGEIVVADTDGSNERVVAEDGEAPAWSPDGDRLAFARCEVHEPRDVFRSAETADCSLWTVNVSRQDDPKLLVEDTASLPIWSPDGRFVAFYRETRPCETFCHSRIVVVPATGGDPQTVGPDLVLASDDRFSWWPGLAWLPEAAPVVVPSKDDSRGNELELQRCVDIWNRARMYPYPTGAVNVSLVEGRCQITLSDYGGVCEQREEMPFRYWCPSHGLGLHQLTHKYRVWNAHGAHDGKLSLFDPPKGTRLPLPQAPPHPMLDGYVIPYGKDGEPLPDLKLTEGDGTCYATGGDEYPLAYPDQYSVKCWWPDSGSDNCFKRPGRLAIGDIVMCPHILWHEANDPMRFVKVRVTKFE